MAAIGSRLADIVSDLVLRNAEVRDVAPVAPGFVRVTLTSPGFSSSNWSPGMKLQLRAQRGGFQLRTYTPVSWDNDTASTQVIGWNADHGPGGRWFGEVAVGDVCEVFGPRRSLPLGDLADDAVFVGDETSIGLASAFHALRPHAFHVFESVDPAALTAALDALGLPAAQRVVVAKDDDRGALLGHLRDHAADIKDPFDIVVTGDVATVRAVRRSARELSARKVHGKAYWAKGRAGLD